MYLSVIKLRILWDLRHGFETVYERSTGMEAIIFWGKLTALDRNIVIVFVVEILAFDLSLVIKWVSATDCLLLIALVFLVLLLYCIFYTFSTPYDPSAIHFRSFDLAIVYSLYPSSTRLLESTLKLNLFIRLLRNYSRLLQMLIQILLCWWKTMRWKLVLMKKCSIAYIDSVLVSKCIILDTFFV